MDRYGYLSQNTIAIVLADYTISCNGVVSSWNFYPQTSALFRAMVLRVVPGTNQATWSVIGVNDVPASAVQANQKSSYLVPISDRIEVQPGDVIGVAQYEVVNPLLDTDILNPGDGTSIRVAVNVPTNSLLTADDIANLRTGTALNTLSSESIFGNANDLKVSLNAEVQAQSDSSQGKIRIEIILPYKVKTQYVHCRLIASYFLFVWKKNSAEMGRRSIPLYN